MGSILVYICHRLLQVYRKSKQKVGFIYQKDVIAEIMEKYTGNIYITKSLYLNFKNEIDEGAATKAIHII